MASIGTLDAIRARDVKRFDRATEEHARMLRDSIRDLERRIMEKTRDLKERKDGRLQGARTNLRLAQQVHKELTPLFDATYGSAARTVVRGFNQVTAWVREDLRDLDVAARWTGIDRDMIDALKQTSLEEFKKLGWDAQQRIASSLYKSVAAMAPADDLRAAISSTLTGQLSKSGRPMESYAQQFAIDTTMKFQNAVAISKAQAAGFNHFRYVGDLIKDSRPFCIERVDQIYSLEDIESWEEAWAGKSGPALTDRGGYNCRHHWQPVDVNWLTDEQRAAIGAFNKEEAEAKVEARKTAAEAKPTARETAQTQQAEAGQSDSRRSEFETTLKRFGGEITDAKQAIELGDIVRRDMVAAEQTVREQWSARATEAETNMTARLGRYQATGVQYREASAAANQLRSLPEAARPPDFAAKLAAQDAEVKRLLAETNAARDAYVKHRDELGTIDEQVNAAVAAEQRAALRRFREFGPSDAASTIEYQGSVGAKMQRTFDALAADGQRSIPTDWLRAIPREIKITQDTPRGYYLPESNTLNPGKLAEVAKTKDPRKADGYARQLETFVHEHGHMLEKHYQKEKLLDLSREIMEQRWKASDAEGRQIAQIPGYDAREVGFKDKWPQPYMGKYYGQPGKKIDFQKVGATELMSMGLPAASGLDPVLWNKMDDELKNFFLGVLTGA